MFKIIKILLVCCFVLWYSCPVYAADFGNAPFTNIQFLNKNNTGEILAIDRYENVYIFDYLNWRKISSGGAEYAGFEHYNSSDNTVLFTDTNTGSWMTSRLMEYNINNNSWRHINTYSSHTYAYDTFFSRNGTYYTVCNKYKDIRKLQNGSWVTISDYPWQEQYGSSYYDEETDALYIALSNEEDNSGSETFYIWKYELSSGAWTNLNISEYGRIVELAYKDGKIFHVEDGYLHINGNFVENMRENDLITGNNILANVDEYGKLYVWNGSSFSFIVDPSITPREVCYDKFGNLFIAGYSDVLVLDQGNVSHTNTDFYTEFVIYDASKSATEAKIAAQEAKAASQSAKASADAAHSDAQNAANRTWYNGNESAYWAYYGYARANSANSNSASAKNMLNGSSNNGKSLAATYDAANKSKEDADYIRSTHLLRTCSLIEKFLKIIWFK